MYRMIDIGSLDTGTALCVGVGSIQLYSNQSYFQLSQDSYRRLDAMLRMGAVDVPEKGKR
jgi:hypothetical protein